MASAPVIGISCSTLPAQEVGDHRRFALPDYYVRCVVEAGGLPLILPAIGPEHVAAYLARLDGLVLSGGWDIDPSFFGEEPHPKLGVVDAVRDEFEIALCKGVLDQGIPLLAICRGVQILNVAGGGTLIQDIPSSLPDAIGHEQQAVRRSALSHAIEIDEGSHLHRIAGAGRARVNSFHHQSVGRPAEGFTVTARTSDGVIEGLEDPTHPFCVGVQWHPERCPLDPFTRGLFAALLEASRKAARAGA